MDTTGFFDYPTLGGGRERRPPTPASCPARPDRSGTPCWRRPRRSGSIRATSSLRAGERDRAFYLLLDGRLEVEGSGAEVLAPAVRRRRRVPRRPAARGDAARARRTASWRGMSWDAYEALAARDPRLGRADPRRPRRAGSPRGCAPPARRLPGWTGERGDRVPELHADPDAAAGRRLAGDPRRDAARARSASRWRSSSCPTTAST